MRRLFWLAMGLGAGVGGAVLLSRWMRRQQERLSPANLGAQIADGVRDLGRLLRETLDEARAEAARVEDEIRSSLAD